MKKMILIALCSLIWVLHTPAQTKSKPSTAPTQKNMEDAMKGLQKLMDGLSPEEKKMMESMGTKIPSAKDVPKATNQQLQNAFDDVNRIVPEKDNARIASISKVPLTNTTLPAYLSANHNNVITLLKPQAKTKGEEIYKLIKTKYNSPIVTGNVAATLWMMGRAELALYVAGKACIDDPSNTDNRNNYAAMLSMAGAEQLALPLLNNLNKRFPKNSTILNNIGQAWFGLGDIDKADAYMDSTIRMFPAHPQANATKSAIEESKGHTSAAVAALQKSIKQAYTKDKEDKLNQLGHELDKNDIRLPFKPIPDPLGLEKFVHPEFPKSVEECIALEKKWEKYRKECNSAMARLDARIKKADAIAIAAGEKRAGEFMGVVNNAQMSGKLAGKLTMPPFFAAKAAIKLAEISEDKDGSYNYKLKMIMDQMANYKASKSILTKNYQAETKNLREKEAKQDGEGKANKDFCPDFQAAADKYLTAYNTEWLQIEDEYLTFMRQKLNQETYYQQYIQFPEDFEVVKLNAEKSWLGIQSTIYFLNINVPICKPGAYQKTGGALAEFDDIHCEYHTQFKTPVGSISIDCSRMTTVLDLDIVKFGLKQDLNKETFGDQYMGCSVEVKAEISKGVDIGPIKAEVTAGVGAAMEFDRNGLRDIVVKASGSVSAGTNMIDEASKLSETKINTGGILGDTEGSNIAGMGIKDLSLEVGLKGQISLMSGKSSVEASGMLEGSFKR